MGACVGCEDGGGVRVVEGDWCEAGEPGVPDGDTFLLITVFE